MPSDGGLVVVVDDDPDVRNVVEMTLELAGFEVLMATDGREGLRLAREKNPDLVLLDVMMPDLDGFEVCRLLKEDARCSHIPVLMLTAKAQTADKIVGLEGGADDYITKPFDGDELVARVKAVLRRTRETGSTSPLTGLPGNVRIQQELARRFSAGETFAVVYSDANHFKSLNDQYGWVRGDQAIAALAEIFREKAAEHGDETTFLGHIGGDDFVIVTSPETAEPIAHEVVKAVDQLIPLLYDEEDLDRGYIELEDRQGNPQRFPLITVSMGIASNVQREVTDHRELVEIATEMKNYAKRKADSGSNYEIDRRRR